MRFAAFTFVVASAALAKDKLIVLPLTVDPSLASQGQAATELVTTELVKDGRFDVIGQSELTALLGIERQKQLLGCSDESGGCTAELTGALGAPYLVTGTIAKTPEGLRVDLKLMQTDRALVLAREGGVAVGEGELLATVQRVLNDLELQLPGAKSSRAYRRLPWGVGSVGGLVAIAGFVLLGVEGVQTGSLQGRTAMGSISGPDARTARGSIYVERAVGVTLAALGTVIAAACVAWWWFW